MTKPERLINEIVGLLKEGGKSRASKYLHEQLYTTCDNILLIGDSHLSRMDKKERDVIINHYINREE